MSKIITPTIGRKVWYWPTEFDVNHNEGHHKPLNQINPIQAIDATVVYAYSDRMVNLGLRDHIGQVNSRMSVPLIQEGDTPPEGGGYATWMPYQVGQAKKEDTPQPISTGNETRTYGDGTVATGVAPLPDQSPAEQDAGHPVQHTEDPDHVFDDDGAAASRV